MARIVYVYGDKATAAQGATVSAASEADASFPKENAITSERGRVWKSTSNGTTTTLDILLSASAFPITGFGIMNLVGTGTPPAVDIRSGASFAGATSRATQISGFWTSTSKDWVDTFAAFASYTDRYWRISFSGHSAPFYVGKVILGTGKDFQKLYSKGSGFDVVPAENETRNVDREPVVMPFGAPRRMFRYNHNTNTDADRLVFETIASEPSSLFGLLDSTGKCNHVRLGPNGVKFLHAFDGNWDTQVEMEQIP